MMVRHIGLWLGLLILLLGCGAVATPTTELAVAAHDVAFGAATWTVAADQPITVAFTNTGMQEHEWVVLKPGTSVSLPFDDDDEQKVLWEIEADAGATTTDIFPAAPVGTYTVVCAIPTHLEQGMKGTLVVQ